MSSTAIAATSAEIVADVRLDVDADTYGRHHARPDDQTVWRVTVPGYVDEGRLYARYSGASLRNRVAAAAGLPVRVLGGAS